MFKIILFLLCFPVLLFHHNWDGHSCERISVGLYNRSSGEENTGAYRHGNNDNYTTYFALFMQSKIIVGNYPVHEKIKTLQVSSPAFANEGNIPSKYSCDGMNINPPLSVKNIPEETKSLVLILEDPDAPLRTWIHWIVWNITPSGHIKENSIPGEEGMNDFRQQHYGGPCPPSGKHRYFFKVYALNDLLQLEPEATKRELEKAMNDHIIAFGELIGVYKRTSR